jgi:lauroyl/myristoyl acyltransferase
MTSSSKLVAQTKGEFVMLVPKTADDFQPLSACCSLSARVRVYVFTLGGSVQHLLLRNLGKCMPESNICELLEVLHIHVQAVMQL